MFAETASDGQDIFARSYARAQSFAEFLNHCTATVSSPQREVTVTMGAGGFPQSIELSEAAYALEGRILARFVLEALQRAHMQLRSQLTDRFGDQSELLSAVGGLGWSTEDDSWQESVVDDFEMSEDDADEYRIPELQQIARLARERIAVGNELQRFFTQSCVEAESADGDVRVRVQGGKVVHIDVKDGATPEGRVFLEVIHAALARFAEECTQQTAQRVEGYAQRAAHIAARDMNGRNGSYYA